ncbi:MAG: GNAT family N-acetyltransferase [Mesorhizobium sp.]|nr:GNAT family N-acetyltransferase [Mesorhizobium sp.]MBL8575899.1 GNAT family N-acetyltransferase [Mesorhizobium sp.]
MNPLHTSRLILRNWQERDRSVFHRINSDDRVMEFFPFRRDRAQSNALLDELRADIDAIGYGFAAVEIASTGECVGFAGLSPVEDLPVFRHGDVEIGWRLAHEHWGKGYATEAASAWLHHAFVTLELDEVISFAVETNHRSTAVMDRLGMHRDPGGDFDYPKVPDDRPQLRRFVLYRIGREEWRRRHSL